MFLHMVNVFWYLFQIEILRFFGLLHCERKNQQIYRKISRLIASTFSNFLTLNFNFLIITFKFSNCRTSKFPNFQIFQFRCARSSKYPNFEIFSNRPSSKFPNFDIAGVLIFWPSMFTREIKKLWSDSVDYANRGLQIFYSCDLRHRK